MQLKEETNGAGRRRRFSELLFSWRKKNNQKECE